MSCAPSILTPLPAPPRLLTGALLEDYLALVILQFRISTFFEGGQMMNDLKILAVIK
jgi:hypothetical protein